MTNPNNEEKIPNTATRAAMDHPDFDGPYHTAEELFAALDNDASSEQKRNPHA